MAGATGGQSQTQMPAAGGAAAMPNATVALIEAVPRSSSGGSSGSTGSSGTSGSSASGAGTGEDRSYRITLRMDDGTTRVVTQDTLPGFRTGDRVNMAGGAISQ
jgi:outer membrane lipoprotein SlyB